MKYVRCVPISEDFQRRCVMSKDKRYCFWLLLIFAGISSYRRGGPDFDPQLVGKFLVIAIGAFLCLFLLQFALQSAWLRWCLRTEVVFARQFKNAWNGTLFTAAVTFVCGFLGWLLCFVGYLIVSLVSHPWRHVPKAAEVSETAWIAAYIVSGIGFLVATVVAYSTTNPAEWEPSTN
jgi:hypothetical protein